MGIPRKKVNLDKLTTQGVHFSQMDVGIQSRDVLAARASRQKGGIHVPRVDTRIRRARRISPDSRLLRHSSYDGPSVVLTKFHKQSRA
jgi:hypothetical protein